MKEFLLFPFYAIGAVLGAAVGLSALAVALVVVVVHRFSFVLCRVGLHGTGCWIRKNMTTPVLVELQAFFETVRKHTRKNPGL